MFVISVLVIETETAQGHGKYINNYLCSGDPLPTFHLPYSTQPVNTFFFGISFIFLPALLLVYVVDHALSRQSVLRQPSVL